MQNTFTSAVVLLAALCALSSSALRVHRGADQLPIDDDLAIYTFTGNTYYEVGLRHGELAKNSIQTFLKTKGRSEDNDWRKNDGLAFFTQLVKTNKAEFPDCAEEINGIAKGAGVTEDDIWMLNLIGEIGGAREYKLQPGETRVSKDPEIIDPRASFSHLDHAAGLASTKARDQALFLSEHCSTLISRFEDEIVLGHTEDWARPLCEMIYLQDVTYPDRIVEGETRLGAHLSGFGYPGQLLGFAIVANAHGVFFTQNSVWPTAVAGDGLSLTLVGRRAMDEQTMDAVIASLGAQPLAFGISVNMISFPERRGANVERSLNGTTSVEYVTESGQHLEHYNAFIRLGNNANGMFSATSRDRADHQHSLHPPDTPEDLKERFCFKGSGKPNGNIGEFDALYRSSTMMTWFAHSIQEDAGVKGEIQIWHGVPACAGEGQPVITWSTTGGFKRNSNEHVAHLATTVASLVPRDTPAGNQ